LKEVNKMGMEKIKLTESFVAKTAAFILLIILMCVSAASALLVAVNCEFGSYNITKGELKEKIFRNSAINTAHDALYTYLSDGESEALELCMDTNISFAICDQNMNLLCGVPVGSDGAYIYSTEIIASQQPESQTETGVDQRQVYTVYTYVNRQMNETDIFSFLDRMSDILYGLRYWGVLLTVICGVASLVLLIFLMCAAGHRAGSENIVPGPMTKIPFDIFSAASAGIIILLWYFVAAFRNNYSAVALYAEIIIAAAIITLSVVTGYCISFAIRVKLGKWWQNTVIYIILHWLFGLIKKFFYGIANFFRNLPLIWKTVLTLMILSAFSLIIILYPNTDTRVSCWLIATVIVLTVVSNIAISLRKLQEGGRKIANGDMSYRVNTEHMFRDFKQHGENLNSIGLGMTRAVDERMKSERMKTELITNVSHDIKTPLTSIINYVDLISKEKSCNEKISEYVEVLSRQSVRLKKLIDDLVEASKASTGSIDVSLRPCDIGVMLAQTAGEYETKLHDSLLELIITKPDTPVMVMADGRLLWRVFDNLMNNICKYAQPDTRVYLGLKMTDGKVHVSFKNVSKYPLNISADELMERFVRGDSSRHTEGSGLGLSIARSLTELQKGKLELSIDGDLFKVDILFPPMS